jgi:hypothetical protein
MQRQRAQRTQRFGRGFLIFSALTAFSALQMLNCTYDSTPPGSDKINDGKPLLMIDASGLAAQRLVRLQVTDLAGTSTLQTQAEKTDATGRLLYPLYMTRGTRSYSITITVDWDGDGLGTGTDRAYTQSAGVFASDTEIKTLKLTAADF